MKRIPQTMDLEMFPPFTGFPEEGLQFLRQLKKHNNREWFAKNKPRYEEFVKLPMQSLIATLKPLMNDLAPDIEVNPRKSMFRIYRDTRFSKNKIPYKTHVSAVFTRHTNWQGSAGFYLQVEPGEVYVGGGIYKPENPQIKKIRHAISTNAQEFLAIVSNDKFHKRLGGIEGEKLQRMPMGFPPDHMMGEWLKYKWMFAGVTWDEKVCLTPKFVQKIIAVYEDILPLVRFINNAL